MVSSRRYSQRRGSKCPRCVDCFCERRTREPFVDPWDCTIIGNVDDLSILARQCSCGARTKNSNQLNERCGTHARRYRITPCRRTAVNVLSGIDLSHNVTQLCLLQLNRIRITQETDSQANCAKTAQESRNSCVGWHSVDKHLIYLTLATRVSGRHGKPDCFDLDFVLMWCMCTT